MNKFVFILGILIMVDGGIAQAQALKDSAVGVKAGLLYGCMSSIGLGLSTPFSSSVMWENNYLYSRTDRSSSVAASDQTELGEIDAEEELDTVIDKAVIKRHMLHTQLRIFPTSDSFNLGLGYSGAYLTADFEAHSESTNAYVDQSYEVFYGTVSISIGNMWKVGSNTYFGIDWIGTNPSTGYQKEFTEESSDETTDGLSEYSRRFEESAMFCARYGGATLLVLSYGLLL